MEPTTHDQQTEQPNSGRLVGQLASGDFTGKEMIYFDDVVGQQWQIDINELEAEDWQFLYHPQRTLQ